MNVLKLAGLMGLLPLLIVGQGCADPDQPPSPTSGQNETATPSNVVDPTPTETLSPTVAPTPSELPATPTVVPTPTEVPTTPTVVPTPTELPPTPTVVPTPTEVPTTPTVVSTPTEIPTTPTVVPTPTELPATPTVVPTPTELPTTPTVVPTPTEVPPTPTVAPTPTARTDADGDGYTFADDCNDSDPDTYPGAPETCNEKDDDCDTLIDDQDPDTSNAPTWYLDADEDGYGRDNTARTQCQAPSEFYTQIGGDCADLDPNINPDATEVCNDIDDDCDGLIDDADDSLDSTTAQLVYPDQDQDGAGDGDNPTYLCDVTTDYVENAEDCDDLDASAYPGAPELCDGIDNDCDGLGDAGALGDGADCAARTCWDILQALPDSEDGVYWIDPTLSGDAFQAYCDMTTDGGGWTVLEKSPFGDAIGKALYRDLPTNDSTPDSAKHRLSKDRMTALQMVAGDLRLDCRGDDYLLTDSANLYAGEGGPNDCSNNVYIHYREASLKGNHLENLPILTWMVGTSEGCAGAWHIDEGAQEAYNGNPKYPWTGSPITSSSADSFAADPNTVDALGHECHSEGATRFTMVRPNEVCGSGLDDDGDGLIDEGTVGKQADDAQTSCQAILNSCPTGHAADGIYYIDPDGFGAMPVFCDMTTDGGGWTLVGSFNNNDGNASWTHAANAPNNLGAWRNDDTFGSLDTYQLADYKAPTFATLSGVDLLAKDSQGGWASYKDALAGTMLDTINGYSACQPNPLEGTFTRSSSAVVNDYGFLSYYGADPNNGGRCAFDDSVNQTDSSVIGMAHQGCGTAGFGHVGWYDGAVHYDRDHYFCLAEDSPINTETGCGSWYGYTSNHWFYGACDYATLFVR